MSEFADELDDFRDLVRITADRTGLPAAAVEKDYYVVRALRILIGEMPEQFIFKGGTSLSKGWDLIKRLSEDIDILFVSEENGTRLSKGELDRRMKKAEEILTADSRFDGEFVTSSKGVHRTIQLNYSSDFEPVASIPAKILVEMGTRGGLFPQEKREITSYMFDIAGSGIAEDLEPISVDCLDFRRTFVEKLFTIYAAFEKDLAKGKMRHYYDLYMLTEREDVVEFIGSDDFQEIFEDVRGFSEISFPGQVCPPNSSYSEWPALYPNENCRAAMNADYRSNRDLFFTEPPTLDTILEKLQAVLK